MNRSFRWGIRFLWLLPLLLEGPAICEEPKTKDSSDKAAAAEPKPGEGAKAAKEEGKEKPASEVKPASGEKAAEAKNKPRAIRVPNQAGIDAIANPLRVLFGGPVEQAVLLPVAGQVAQVEAGDNDPLTLQFMQQLRPLLNAELGFVRTVCSELTAEQRPKIREAAEEGLKLGAKQMATDQMRPRQAGIQVNGVPPATSNPLKTLREAISKALEETLSAEQMAKFKQESSGRINDHRKTAILAVISAMDSQLYLSDDQRNKISGALESKWQDEWENWASVMTTYANRYLPMMPENCVGPYLSDDQKAVWQSIGKINPRNWVIRNRQAMENDDWWGSAPAQQPAARATRVAN